MQTSMMLKDSDYISKSQSETGFHLYVCQQAIQPFEF
jgi:hypothetical protein